ncbi:hypothetical protein PRZ48_005006 [Zasmidium cellare]|uniref:Tat pathway signal sequence n=1 Tax=Zasmidium cellare TaxID=395010 RepID=A0ABR0ER57_ZASCE|nr:hypothetical protein PRZ48_005006 [Zasmidium cellare]
MKHQPESALRQPASKRISSPASQRLQSVSDRHPRAPPPIPVKSILRNSTSTLSLPSSIIVTPPQDHDSDKQTSSSGTAATSGTAPPSYKWIPEQQAGDNESSLDSGPVEGEKLAELRKNGGYRRKHKRGGWWRMLLLIIVFCVVVVGLAVGLGVGLTVGRRKHESQINESGSTASGTSGNDTQGSGPQPFPIGQYTMLTALKNVSTGCTSNAETWTCYPRTTYDPSDPSAGGLATFDWILTNTSSIFATMGSGPTADEGVPANISISSTDNPLSIGFNDRPLTYISSASNSSTARLTFSYTMGKSVFPATSLTNNNIGSQCFFNQTVFTGTLYLSAPRNYPTENTNSSSVQSSSTNIQWPYAVEVTQSSPGGEDTPACYEYMNGSNGDRITTGLTAQPASSQCSCNYNNF